MSKNKKKICLLVFSLRRGGAESNAINLAHYINSFSNTLEVELILIKDINEYVDEYAYKFDRISIHTLLSAKKKPLLLRPFIFIYTMFSFMRYVRNQKYDLILTESPHICYHLAFFASFVLKKRLVLIIGFEIFSFIKKIGFAGSLIDLFILRLELIYAHRIICVSTGACQQILRHFSLSLNKCSIINNGIDYDHVYHNSHIQKYSKVAAWKGRDKLLIFIGRNSPLKGLDFLILTFYKLTLLSPFVKLLIVSNTELSFQTKKLIKKYYLSNKIKFIKSLSSPFVFFQFADIFILPSLYEAFGNVILEALANKVPVISTNCSGPREILSQSGGKINISTPRYCKYGVLVPSINNANANTNLYSQTIFNLLHNKKKLLHYRKNGAFRAKQFTIQKMGDLYIKVISQELNLVKKSGLSFNKWV